MCEEFENERKKEQNIFDLQIRGLKYNFHDYTVKHRILKCSKEVHSSKLLLRQSSVGVFFQRKKKELFGLPKF